MAVQGAAAVAVNPASNRIYVARSTTIDVVDGLTNTVTGTVYVGVDLIGVAVNPDDQPCLHV